MLFLMKVLSWIQQWQPILICQWYDVNNVCNVVSPDYKIYIAPQCSYEQNFSDYNLNEEIKSV